MNAIITDIAGYTLRQATPEDCPSARSLMLATFEQDFGYGYVAAWHQDTDDLQGFYLDNPHHALFVAVDEQSGKVVATTGVRKGGPRAGSHPDWLVARYDPERTAEIVRVYVDLGHRRKGLAQALVELARQWVCQEEGYKVLYLHTNGDMAGSVAFWRAAPTIEIFADTEGSVVQGHKFHTVHFEIPLANC